jgi:lysophospholipid acyltransferase (LPLAT)-like uncharacterized protein
MSDLGWFEACFLKVFGAEIERGSTTRGGAPRAHPAPAPARGGEGRHDQRGRAARAARAGEGGAVFLARKTGIPIVPGAASFRPGYRIKGSWDRSFVPMPFARATVVIGEPILVRQDGGTR